MLCLALNKSINECYGLAILLRICSLKSCLTMYKLLNDTLTAFVFSNSSSLTSGLTASRYFCRVCSSGGTGKRGRDDWTENMRPLTAFVRLKFTSRGAMLTLSAKC